MNDFYIEIKTRRFIYREFLIVNTKDDTIERIFRKNEIPVWYGSVFEKEGEDTYFPTFIMIHKKYEQKFLDVMQNINKDMCLLGYPDYADFCNNFFRNLKEQCEADKEGK